MVYHNTFRLKDGRIKIVKSKEKTQELAPKQNITPFWNEQNNLTWLNYNVHFNSESINTNKDKIQTDIQRTEGGIIIDV